MFRCVYELDPVKLLRPTPITKDLGLGLDAYVHYARSQTQ